MRRKIILLVILSSLIRLVIAGSLELGNDEVYYQSYAQHLQWSYFDHPPMVAWIIRLTTANLFLQREIFIRLGSILFAAIGTILIFFIGKKIKNEKTGWIAAVLYTSSFYTSVIAGIFILPDSPEVVFWLASMYCMILINDGDRNGLRQNLSFILLGFLIGLCILSKIHGIFLWLGFGIYTLLHRRDMLRLPFLWISVALTALVASPIFFWNLSNHFITYSYHQGRIHFFGARPDFNAFLQQVFGSAFYNNPVNIILYICAGISMIKGRKNNMPAAYQLLLWLSLPLILVLLCISVFSETLPHWSGPAYLSWMLLAACWLENKTGKIISIWLRSSAVLSITIVAVAVLAISFLPVPMDPGDPSRLGKGDITLDMSGWKIFAIELDSMYNADLKSGVMKPGALILSDYWFPAGHLDHYYALPYHKNLIVFGPLSNVHHFAWLNQLRPRLRTDQDGYFICPSNYYGPPDILMKMKFRRTDEPMLIPQYRAGIPVRNFLVFRMHGFKGDSLSYLNPDIR
jgi:hypothetical protein